jgi:hypothetical protein
MRLRFMKGMELQRSFVMPPNYAAMASSYAGNGDGQKGTARLVGAES